VSTGGDTGALASTGSNAKVESALGFALIVGGLGVVAVSQRRRELERLAWPDER
jgi:LPXTG-motif cell wall-anchored protein